MKGFSDQISIPCFTVTYFNLTATEIESLVMNMNNICVPKTHLAQIAPHIQRTSMELVIGRL